MADIPIDELPQLTHQYDGLDVFVVGGAVRDWLRGVTPTDIDLMVTGVSREEMESRGFNRIDSSNNDTFGVFQDSLNREVSLAREESSTGEGHTAFDIEPVSSDVDSREALHRDLLRRDLTINAMAFDMSNGELIDPHDGKQDLENGIISAVDADAFRQDPLRILRAARFVARLEARLDYNTMLLMMEMVDSLEYLPQERVRMEMIKSLKQADQPRMFFEVLADVSALAVTFPELEALREVPAGPEKYHGEGSAFRHTLMVLDEMAEIRPNDELALLMALAHDLGKAETDSDDLPSHPNHGRAGLDIIEKMAQRLSLSNKQKKVMKDAAGWHMPVNDVTNLRESTVLDLVQEVYDPARLVALAQADSLGREPQGSFNQADAFRRFANASKAIEEWDGQRLIEQGYDPDEMGGVNFGNLLRQKRVETMRELES